MSERATSLKAATAKKIAKPKSATCPKLGVIATIAAALTAQGGNDRELTPEAYKLLHGLCRAKQDCSSSAPDLNTSITSIMQLNNRMQVMESWKKNHVKAKLLKIDYLWGAYSQQHPADAQAAEATIDSICQSTRAKRQARRQLNEEVIGEMEVGGNGEEDEPPLEEAPRTGGVKTRGKPKSKASAASSSK